jgi:imidazolonepropionase-like amidohydrolase
MKMYFRLACLVFAAGFAVAQQRIVIDAGTLLDGKGGIRKNQQIVIEGSKIVAIGPARGKATYDLKSMTVMPGWIDVHVHITWHFDAHNQLFSGPENPEDAALYAAENAWITLQGGFTTIQSVGAPLDAPLRDRINKGLLPGPRILTSIRQITNRTAGGTREHPASPEALREFVRKTKNEGADLIKMFTTGSARNGPQTMSDEQIQAVCDEAKKVGLRTLVHAISDNGARASTLAGCSEIEHGDFASDATLDLMAQRGTFFDPNLLVCHNYIDRKESFPNIHDFTDLEDSIATINSETLPHARARKIKVVYGTDAVAGAHGRNAEEFIYRVRDAHDKPMDELLSATSVAAESLALGDKIGTLAPGFEADIVATDGNMLDDITAVRRVVFVMKGGKVYRNTR